jgi:hypothetical protein
LEFMVFHHVGRRSSMATVDATGIIFINVWRFEVLSLILTELFWLLYRMQLICFSTRNVVTYYIV